jgi:hypothetical protein
MNDRQNEPTKKTEVKQPVANPELHLVDLGEVSQNTSLTISTGKFEILVRLRKPKE